MSSSLIGDWEFVFFRRRRFRPTIAMKTAKKTQTTATEEMTITVCKLNEGDDDEEEGEDSEEDNASELIGK